MLQPIQSKRAIKIEAVCNCAVASTFEDTKLAQLESASESEVRAALRDPVAQSYFLGRALQSTMRCAATELDASLAKAK